MHARLGRVREVQLARRLCQFKYKLKQRLRLNDAVKLQRLDGGERRLELEVQSGQFDCPMNLRYAGQDRLLREVSLQIKKVLGHTDFKFCTRWLDGIADDLWIDYVHR